MKTTFEQNAPVIFNFLALSVAALSHGHVGQRRTIKQRSISTMTLFCRRCYFVVRRVTCDNAGERRKGDDRITRALCWCRTQSTEETSQLDFVQGICSMEPIGLHIALPPLSDSFFFVFFLTLLSVSCLVRLRLLFITENKEEIYGCN